jgi:dihydroorotate dehydrogenase
MRFLLSLLPPEAAHRAAIWGLKHGLGPRAGADDPRLAVSLFGKTFPNPVGLAAGAEKKGEALKGWARMGFGFVEAGTVTLEARAGNPAPRVWRLGGGQLVNWMGLPGAGLAPFVANLEAFSRTEERKRCGLGVSIASPEGNIDAFRRLSAACAPLADYLTLNASCPNVQGHGNAELGALEAQVRAVRAESGGRPVLVKIDPPRDDASLHATVDAAMNAGAAGIVAVNTVSFAKRDVAGLSLRWPERDGKPVGGYSGPALLQVAFRTVAKIRARLGPGAPVIGVGGIQSGADARGMMEAGADAVQLYTGLVYRGPGLLKEIKGALLTR